MIPKGSTVLFQGDSITDAGRARDAIRPNEGLGGGYAFLAATQVRSRRPADGLRFLNAGISGNRIVDLYARWREDCLNLKPDVVSILIGVNDTWHEFSRQAGVAIPKFGRVYRQLLEETREALPKTKLILCEPFILKCGAVTPEWYPDVEQRLAVTHKLAKEFNALVVPFQKMFNDAAKEAPPEFWAADGVHPTAPGHQRMAEEWIRVVEGK